MSTYTPIATQTLGSAASSVTFSSLPQNYTDLIVVIGSATFSANSTLYVQYNGDTGANYSSTVLSGDGSAASSSRTTSVNGAQIGAANGQSSTVMQTCIVNIQNYSNSTTNKTAISRWSRSDAEVSTTVSLWRNTNAITSIEIYGGYGNGTKNSNMQSGTTITVYGVAAGNSSAKASGGNIVTTDGSYWYHTFTSSGVFIPSQALTCDYLVVAGGGGGGGSAAGGGGGGGYRTSIGGTPLSLTTQTYSAIVGAGGVASTSLTAAGASGSNSSFSTISSTGGGGGGSYPDLAGLSGGSGGGGGYAYASGGAGNAGSYSPVEGYAGSVAFGGSGSDFVAGGGGGAGGAATTGNGANGATNSISGTSVTYAGGGGAAVGNNVAAKTGGTGGGGTGARRGTSSATSGTANTGGGGGGGDLSALTAGKGGSGIIIIRYAV